MFISVLELFKVGIGPSSSHTVGPMLAALDFRQRAHSFLSQNNFPSECHIKCILKGSLAFTGKGHATDRAIVMGLQGYSPESVIDKNINTLIEELWACQYIVIENKKILDFLPNHHIIFDCQETLKEHPNGLVFQLIDSTGNILLQEVYFSIGGGFIIRQAEMLNSRKIPENQKHSIYPFAFDSAKSMLEMSRIQSISIAEMKFNNEITRMSEDELNKGIDKIWHAMKLSISNGLNAEGVLPGGLKVTRRAKEIHDQLQASPERANLNDWLCVYAMAVNEENAAGNMVVTAPTNGAAGVIPSVLNYMVIHEAGTRAQIRAFLLVAAAIGGLIKHRSSISGAEVGCQGEVGSAAAMAAAGICAVKGGSSAQIENAAEIALEHHLGMTCDPINGLVQIPCIERNGFGAIKAYAASCLAIRGSGTHIVSLDNCIAAMKQTGEEMSNKYKETALGGLAVNFTEC